jgi:hypothetical protein
MSLGAPINSPRDDVFFVLSANGLHAYFSSFKEDSYGETDLYRIDFQQPAQIQYMYVRGTIEVCENQVIPHIDIIATNTKTLEIAGVYVPNIRTGKFFMALSPDNSYDISFDYQGDVFKEDKLVFNENSDQSHYLGFIQLPFLQCQKTRAYKNLSAGKLLTRIYFSGVYYDIARNTDLDNLANYLLLHAESTIGLTSYTTTNGIKPDLYELATKRLKSVKLYLLNKGVLESQLKTNIAGPSSSLSQFVGSENYDDRVEIHILDDSGTKLELIWTDPVNYGYEKP